MRMSQVRVFFRRWEDVEMPDGSFCSRVTDDKASLDFIVAHPEHKPSRDVIEAEFDFHDGWKIVGCSIQAYEECCAMPIGGSASVKVSRGTKPVTVPGS